MRVALAKNLIREQAVRSLSSDLTQIPADSVSRNPQHRAHTLTWAVAAVFCAEIRDVRPLTGPRPESFKWATNLILKTVRIALSGAPIHLCDSED